MGGPGIAPHPCYWLGENKAEVEVVEDAKRHAR
jgi:hypothetical protein